MLTERKQKRLLYHLFTEPRYREHDTSDLDGVDPDPLEFTEPWKTIYLRAANPIRAILGASDLYQGVQYVAEDDEDVRRLMIEIEAAIRLISSVFMPTPDCRMHWTKRCARRST